MSETKPVSFEPVTIELSRPEYRFRAEEIAKFDVAPDVVKARVTAQLFQSAVQAKYPNGMDARDARRWGPILERLLDGENLSLSRGDFDWLYRIFLDDDLRLMAEASHYRIALETYLVDLKESLKPRAE